MKNRNSFINPSGFTLLELMIVIAIIGILAAIALPNFISYRDKSFCTTAESDANSVINGLAEYFAIPANISRSSDLAPVNPISFGVKAVSLSGNNQGQVAQLLTTTGYTYRITIYERSGRCPQNYMTSGISGGDGWKWVTAGSSYFQKTL